MDSSTLSSHQQQFLPSGKRNNSQAVKPQASQHLQPSQSMLPMVSSAREDQEVRVEKALLDLSEMKTQMVVSEASAPKKSTQSNFQQTSYSTQSAFPARVTGTMPAE